MSDPKIAQLHDLYCKATGFSLPLRMGRDRAWFDFDKAGFTGEDLLLVIRWIRRQACIIRSGYTVSSLRFSKLIVELDYFEEKLHLARMEERSNQRRPATVLAEQKVGSIRRQIEVPPPDSGPANAGAVGATLLKEWRQRQSGQLPTSECPTSEATRGTP